MIYYVVVSIQGSIQKKYQTNSSPHLSDFGVSARPQVALSTFLGARARVTPRPGRSPRSRPSLPWKGQGEKREKKRYSACLWRKTDNKYIQVVSQCQHIVFKKYHIHIKMCFFMFFFKTCWTSRVLQKKVAKQTKRTANRRGTQVAFGQAELSELRPWVRLQQKLLLHLDAEVRNSPKEKFITGSRSCYDTDESSMTWDAWRYAKLEVLQYLTFCWSFLITKLTLWLTWSLFHFQLELEFLSNMEPRPKCGSFSRLWKRWFLMVFVTWQSPTISSYAPLPISMT